MIPLAALYEAHIALGLAGGPGARGKVSEHDGPRLPKPRGEKGGAGTGVPVTPATPRK